MLKIWGRKNSSNVRKALWIAHELGLDFESIDAGGAFGVVDEPHYRARNPNGLVPMLEDDDLVLWESNAIVRYLCAQYGRDQGWYLDDPRQRALADKSAVTCKSSVDLPMPGSPPISVADPSTRPPPVTRSNSWMPQTRRGACSDAPDSAAKGMTRPLPRLRPCGGRSCGTSSLRQFHSPQASHLPAHLLWNAPQD